MREDIDPRTVARQAWEELAKAHKSGNFQGYLDRLTEDYRFQMPLGEWREVHVGRAEAARCYAGISASRPELTFHEPLRVTQHGATVVIEFEDEGTIAGKPYRNRIASSFDVRGNQICGYREYFGEIDPELITTMNKKVGADECGDNKRLRTSFRYREVVLYEVIFGVCRVVHTMAILILSKLRFRPSGTWKGRVRKL